eukprot:913115-Amphidinium_carterae.1
MMRAESSSTTFVRFDACEIGTRGASRSWRTLKQAKEKCMIDSRNLQSLWAYAFQVMSKPTTRSQFQSDVSGPLSLELRHKMNSPSTLCDALFFLVSNS